jgi:methylglutaconyl-CoA hydratase
LSSPYEDLQLIQSDGVALLTLDRPEKRNALTARLMEEILHALDTVEASSSGVVVLTGAGEAFCAGMDLDHLKSLVNKTPAEHRADSVQIARLMRRIYDFPKPTIAAVNGAAIAGGTGIVSVCDFAYAVPEAKFGFTEVRIGFVPAVVSAFLRSQVGERVARDLLLTGRIFKAQEALEVGLINGVVEAAEMTSRVAATAKALLANSPTSLKVTKKLLSAFAAARLNFELDLAMAENAAIRQEPDFQEGISSFLEKRSPVWKR